jgi:hypothetical protein
VKAIDEAVDQPVQFETVVTAHVESTLG